MHSSFWHNYRVFRRHMRGEGLAEVRRCKEIVRVGPLVYMLNQQLVAAIGAALPCK